MATEDYDMDFWHYQPMWMQPPVILILGVLLVAGANIVAEPSIKTTVLAAGPVGLLLGIFLFVLPRQFKSFATQYMDSHDMDDDLNSPSKSISPPRRK